MTGEETGERDSPRAIRRSVTEARLTPDLSLLLGYAAMLPAALCAAAVLVFAPAAAEAAADFSVVWGGALLLFLSGVRRGLSFRTPDGPRASEIAVVLWLFLLGLGALLSPERARSLALLLIGFASLIALDPIAARRGAAPPFFARLRPVQMAIPAASYAAILAAAP